MAGLGFKDFQVGEVLTSSDVDGYLMQQSVMRFADSAARGSALGTAVGTGVALAEGMVSYLDDANYVQVYNGSGWISAIPGIGSNVVQAVKTDTFTTTTSGWQDIPDLSVTITPSSATAKILLIAYVVAYTSNAAGASWALRLTGGNAATFIADTDGSRTPAYAGARPATATLPGGSQHSTGIYLDSPATASPVTYDVEIFHHSGTVYVNRTSQDVDSDEYPRMVSSLTAIEVAA